MVKSFVAVEVEVEVVCVVLWMQVMKSLTFPGVVDVDSGLLWRCRRVPGPLRVQVVTASA